MARFLMWRGRLKVQGWNNLLRLVNECDGRCIIVSNHPTLWEPIFIKVLLWKWYTQNFNRNPKNVTAIDELGKYPAYIRTLFRYAGLIPVDRDARSQNTRLFLTMAHELKRKCPIIVCPEGRCTATPARRENESDTTYPADPAPKEAYMLMPRSGVLVFAYQEKVPIITAKVTLGAPLWFMSESHWLELKRIFACGMTIEFSDSLFVSHPTTTVEELAHAILHPTTSSNASRM